MAHNHGGAHTNYLIRLSEEQENLAKVTAAIEALPLEQQTRRGVNLLIKAQGSKHKEMVLAIPVEERTVEKMREVFDVCFRGDNEWMIFQREIRLYFDNKEI